MTSSDTPYRFENAPGCSVISLRPELNDAQWSDIEKVGTDILSQLNSVNNKSFLVDLSALNYMGSAMVALIVRLWKSVKEANGRMVVVNREQMVFEVLKIAGLHKVWTIVDTREEGLRQLGVRGGMGSAAGGGSLLGILGVVAAAVAAIGIGLLLSGSTALAPKAALAIGLIAAVAGLVLGTITAVMQGGTQRILGIVAVAISVVVLIGGIVHVINQLPA